MFASTFGSGDSVTGARAETPIRALSIDVCKEFSEDMVGDVFCDRRSISRYKFDWANSDCNDILPLVVVRPKTDEDIARAVRRSASHGIPLSYRSGGHSYTCDGIKPDSIHIDLRSRKEKRLYRQGDSWYAEFETGNTFRDLFEIIDRNRFSFIHGACHAVGVGGFYLHGGLHLNSLSSIYGWGNETVVNMTVISAAGEILALSSTSPHQDLWRAMLRAGSNFAIATSLTVRVFERPEPRTWLFWATMSHADAILFFRRALMDRDVQLNPFYVNPPFFQMSSERSQTFTFQFSLLNAPNDYWQNLRMSVDWFRSQGFPLSWWTIAFNAVVPKPDDFSTLGYQTSWASSHAIWPASSNCTTVAMDRLLERQSVLIRRHRFHSLVGIDCWLTFAKVPGDRIYYEYNCPGNDFYTKYLQAVEAEFFGICKESVKYRNTPHRNASTHRYYPDYKALLPAKRKWDPQFLLGPTLMSLRDFKEPERAI
jgi:hypothetical protein